MVSETFLGLNRLMLIASDTELVVAFMAPAAGKLSEEELADRFRQRIVST